MPAVTTSALLWLGTLAGLPALVAIASLLELELERLRRIAFAAASGLVAVALAPAVAGSLRKLGLFTRGGEALLRVNALSSVLLPFAAGLWLLTVAVTPRGSFDRAGHRRAALATLTTLASFLTESAVALLLLQAAAVMIFFFALNESADRHQRRVVAAYLGASTILLGGGVAMLVVGRSSGVETAGLWLIAMAALLRKGILPFHAWVPEVFDHGRLGPAILFSAPQVGAYITVVLIIPRAPAGLLHTIAILALATAIYGSALALVEHSARRACGYLFVSQSALVMAGLGCGSATALAGGLLEWLSAGLAFAGLARVVLMLEARRGRLDLTHYHGGYERTPMLAISFLALGLACAAFPGTLGFIGQELLVKGAVDVFPVMGYAIAVASALTGVAVVRMYFSLFCGRTDKPTHRSLHFELKRHEAAAFVALLVVLIGFGLGPRRLINSRLRASRQILQLRRTPAMNLDARHSVLR
ncbi:MAG TPA: proton-conducting transporter membrane subunit [Terriglobales bacterium]|nr:proton-conducting transporter membrane subunit [Terriglobales bacterium]